MLARAVALSGRTVSDVAAMFGLEVPETLKYHKGFVGQLLEIALGAAGDNEQGPDFPSIGVELKSIPIRPDGRPLESTWVTRATSPVHGAIDWESSAVWMKLRRVLWVPVVVEPEQSVGARIIGSPLLWSPNASEYELLRRDWTDLTERLLLGGWEDVHAGIGDALQLRPKGRWGSDASVAADADGRAQRVQSKGFYLRSRFTRDVLARGFGLV